MNRYAVVGHSTRRPFASLTYGGLKENGKTVYAVDSSVKGIEGDPTYPDFASLPQPVEGVVLELPNEETNEWVKKAVEAGVKDIWIHDGSDTPEAVETARQAGVRLRTGTCAVMYLKKGFSPHTIHGFIRKLLSRY